MGWLFQILAAVTLVLAWKVEAQNQTLIPLNATWSYLDTGVDPGAAWTAIGFNDTAWKAGPAELGYGDGDEATVIGYGPDLNAKFITTWFRRTLTITNSATFSALYLNLVYDDGAVVYINGTEVFRVNLPTGPITPATPATVSADFTPINIVLSPNQLQFGTNTVAVEMHQAASNSTDLSFALELTAWIDDEAPKIAVLIPLPGEVDALPYIEVHFNEPVQGVDPADLLINGQPATGLASVGSSRFIFSFPSPPTGVVSVAFASAHGITDGSPQRNAFGGNSWTYTMNPLGAPFLISEFMASNSRTLNDNYGANPDWVEIWNRGSASGDLLGWFLTDDRSNLSKWRFPARTLEAGSYLVVFASSRDETNSPVLHTNFQLKDTGEYLALVDPQTNIVSEFAPVYPRQFTDVSYGRDRLNPSISGFFSEATPGAPNATTGSDFAPAVQFSRDSGTFPMNQPFGLELFSGANPGTRIYYSFGTNLPGTNTFLYSGPLFITGTTAIRARAFVPGLLPSPVVSKTYIALSTQTNVVGFQSDLPIMIIHNYGQGTFPASGTAADERYVYVQTFENAGGPASMVQSPSLDAFGIMHTRGNSTLFPSTSKASFTLEIQDEFREPREVSLLGLPPESDWILDAPDSFDPALFQNALALQLAQDGGEYASRTRFFELYLKDDSGPPGPISSTGFTGNNGDYHGIYVLIEKIKRDSNRVAIEKLEPEHTQPPEVTGGYLLSIDRTEPGEGTIPVTGASINALEPRWSQLTNANRAAQYAYVRNYFNAFAAGLAGGDLTNTTLANGAPNTNHHTHYIDVSSWVRRHVHEVLMLNVDALRLGGHFFKAREKRIEYGPAWDYDRSQGSTDGRDFNPRTWRATSGDLGTDYFNFSPWWGPLFRAPDFWQAWIDRYQRERQPGGSLSNTNVDARINQFYEELRNAQPRERARWNFNTRTTNGSGSGTYADEVTWRKRWYDARLNFMDTNFLPMPSIRLLAPNAGTPPEARISPGSKLGSSVIYMLDGTDPRLPNGAISPSAFSNTAPVTIAIPANARIVARSYHAGHRNLTGLSKPPLTSPWSAPQTMDVRSAAPTLRITEIMYHPRPGTNDGVAAEDFQFVEVKNTGPEPILLGGIRFSRGIDFTFPSSILPPGKYVVAVRNRAAFESRYGSGLPVAGEFTGILDQGGETLSLVDILGDLLQNVTYDDRWYDLTDGPGLSLVAVENETAGVDPGRASWRASRRLHGSPGAPDPVENSVIPVVINEVLANSASPFEDFVELFNPTTSPADISHWYLTDDYDEPKKFRFPPGTVVNGLGFLAIDEHTFNANPGQNPLGFAFNATGDAAFLFSADASGELTGYVHGLKFGGTRTNETLARIIGTDGTELFVRQAQPTVGATNFSFAVAPVGVRPTLAITEIMVDPSIPIGWSPVDAADTEFIELKNIGLEPIELGDAEFTAGISFVFPPLILDPGRYTVVVRSRAAFVARYGTNLPIAGEFLGGLAAEGERLVLRAAMGETLLDFAYTTEPFPLTRGFGFALVLTNDSALPTDYSIPTAWRCGSIEEGSPGRPDPGSPHPVFINEVLLDGQADPNRQFELYNPGTQAVDVSGWWIVGDQNFNRPATIPVPAIVPPGGYLALGLPLADVRQATDDGYIGRLDLYSRDPAENRLTGFRDTFEFGPGFPRVPFGPYIDSVGRRRIVPLSAGTVGAANATPRVGPVVISEIHYRPPDLYFRGAWVSNVVDEFIELRNLAALTVPLYDPERPTNAWRMSGDVTFSFPAGTVLAPAGICVVVSFDPSNSARQAQFRALYRVPSSVAVYGPWTGTLQSPGTVKLARPVPTADWDVVDRIEHEPGSPWPAVADGVGFSLHRVELTAYGNDPTNWQASLPSPGVPFIASGPAPLILQAPTNTFGPLGGIAELRVVGGGASELVYRWLFNNRIIPGASNHVLRIENLQFSDTGEYRALVGAGDQFTLSSPARLEVLQGAVILQHPGNVTVRIKPDAAAAPSTNAVFWVDALSDYPPISYQWLFNARPIPGASASTLKITNVQTNDFGGYSCAITDRLGTILSSNAMLYPVIQVGISQQPVSNLTVAPNGLVALSCVITGFPPPFHFQWRQGTVSQTNQVSHRPVSIFSFRAPSVPFVTSQYRVVVTNAFLNPPGIASPFSIIATGLDTDHDGLLDELENATPGFSPTNPLDALADADGDGLTNGDESYAGTDPHDPLSYLRIEPPWFLLPGLEGNVSLQFLAVSNRVYTVENRNALDSDPWRIMIQVAAAPTNRVITVVDPDPPSFLQHRVYRLVTPESRP